MSLYVGASGFSYPSWKPGFYPAGTKAGDFLRTYAERLNTVELNTTGYRLPEEAQFRRWAEETPDGFRFAVKMPHPNRLQVFTERVRNLGERLGPVRIMIQQVRDDDFLARLLGSLDPDVNWALDFRHESWAGVETGAAVAVNALEGRASFRYLRLREPPYDEATLAVWADRIRPLLADGINVYAYFKHENEPTAPAYAEQLRALCETA
ncbi:MAG TPA: DUF72 domain-containing protein [Gaiellaceae bacterium]|nr:DUF72 domain-containing protein [Gaiellaceae bacterium]